MKNKIREKALQARNSITRKYRAEKGSLIMERILKLPEFKQAHVVFFYASFRSEVETITSLRSTLAQGKRVILPVVIKKDTRLALYEILTFDELSPGYMGIPEPSRDNKKEIDLSLIDFVIIPGAAYDLTGSRIGYGGGYYDRLLELLDRDIPIVAPAFKEQVVDTIPSEPHDKKVTIIVTEDEVIHCKS